MISSWQVSPMKPGAQVHPNALAEIIGMHEPMVMNPAGAGTEPPDAVMLLNWSPDGDTPSESSAKNMKPASPGREMVQDAPVPACHTKTAPSGPCHSHEPATQTLFHEPVGMDCSGPHVRVASSHTQAVAPRTHTLLSVVAAHHADNGVPLSVESRHTARLLHGVVSHSSTSMVHLSPVKPAGHAQAKPSTWSEHWPSFAHGASAHSSMSEAHVKPSNPGAQEHRNSPYGTVLGVPDSVQMAPFTHGSAAHSFASITQAIPLVPGGQSQANPAAELEQLASAKHGMAAQ